ncbi:MAG: TonB family protein [Gemmatimonadales bacterium]|nr:TonB family protein [Gemmatimonadales bacterium]
METLSINRELNAIRERTNRLAVASVVIHLLGGFIILNLDSIPLTDPETDYLVTEITWLAPTPVEISSPALEPETEQAPDPLNVASSEETQQVILPTPGKRSPTIGERLASLRQDKAGRHLVANAAASHISVKRNSVLASFIPVTGRKTADLTRNRKTELSPVRSAPRPIQRAAIEVTAIAELTAPPQETAAAKQEISPGISLAGPVSDRELLSFNTPTYPEWAKQDGVEVSVELLFTVLPSGRVKENVRVEKTSGYQDFDQRAKSSLLSWLFETLGGGSTAEQWGRIEFNYRLKQAG